MHVRVEKQAGTTDTIRGTVVMLGLTPEPTGPGTAHVDIAGLGQLYEKKIKKSRLREGQVND